MAKALKGELPIQTIERIYGKDKGKATLEECATWLRQAGYKSLADFLAAPTDTNTKEELGK